MSQREKIEAALSKLDAAAIESEDRMAMVEKILSELFGQRRSKISSGADDEERLANAETVVGELLREGRTEFQGELGRVRQEFQKMLRDLDETQA